MAALAAIVVLEAWRASHGVHDNRVLMIGQVGAGSFAGNNGEIYNLYWNTTIYGGAVPPVPPSPVELRLCHPI